MSSLILVIVEKWLLARRVKTIRKISHRGHISTEVTERNVRHNNNNFYQVLGLQHPKHRQGEEEPSGEDATDFYRLPEVCLAVARFLAPRRIN